LHATAALSPTEESGDTAGPAADTGDACELGVLVAMATRTCGDHSATVGHELKLDVISQ